MISSSLNYLYKENERTASFELTQQRSSINLIDFHYSHSAVRQPALEFQLDSVTRRATQCKLRIINSVDRHVGKFQLIQQVKYPAVCEIERECDELSAEKNEEKYPLSFSMDIRWDSLTHCVLSRRFHFN